MTNILKSSNLNVLDVEEDVDIDALMENVDTIELKKKVLPFSEIYEVPNVNIGGNEFHIPTLNIYKLMYEESINNPESFWDKLAKENLRWIREYTMVRSKGPHFSDRINWFLNGKLNACDNCVDRWAEVQPDKVAIIWESDDPSVDNKVTYKELFENVCRMANVLKKFGIKKGDSVGIYMPMIPEVIYSMLACARIGAVHMVVFGGFAAPNLSERLLDSKCKIVITANKGIRGNKIIPLKDIVDKALSKLPHIHTCIVFSYVNNDVNYVEGRDYDGHYLMKSERPYCPLEEVDSEDPLFYLYTSGSTGSPKGIMHTTAGYLLYVTVTQKYLFDVHPGDIFGCVGDIGWITSHSYLLYSTLCNGITTILFEGVPTYPDPGRYWSIIEKHSITHFYTAPTAIRALKRYGDDYVVKYDRSSLKILGSVGEPIDPSAWRWYKNVVGDGRCPVIDTYWQTESGGILIAPFPGCVKTKPGSATLPFFGIEPVIINPQTGEEIHGSGSGVLCIKNPWPGIFKSIFNSHYLQNDLYLNPFPNYYFTGDGVFRDHDGYYWVTGRVDDTINISGHRLSSKEIEDALTSRDFVSEAAAVAIEHEVKGHAIACFVVLHSSHFHTNSDYNNNFDDLNCNKDTEEDLRQYIRKQIGPVASPDHILIVDAIPKTRSGKVVRRLLRKIITDSTDYGDISTVYNPECIQKIVKSWNLYIKNRN